MTPADQAAARLDLARYRVSAEFGVPLDLVTGATEGEMRDSALAQLVAYRSTRR